MEEHKLVFNAIHELKIDVPVMSYKVNADGSITLSLYGGQVVTWSPQAEKPAAPPKPKPVVPKPKPKK